MSEKVLTYKKSENDRVYIRDYEMEITSLAYLRCTKLYEKYLKTRNSGVKDFTVAKRMDDIGPFGDVVTRLKYFDEGKLITKLVFVACMDKFKRHSRMGWGISDSIHEHSIEILFRSFLEINKILQPETFPSDKKLDGNSRTQQIETASMCRNFFNCNISDCEFVLCNSDKSSNELDYSSYEKDEHLNITYEILSTDKSNAWLRLKGKWDTTLRCDPKDNYLKISFFENFRIRDDFRENNNEFIIKEMQSLFDSSDSNFQKLCEHFQINMKFHFSTSTPSRTCEALSEKSDFLQKFKKDFGLKSRFAETIDPTCSTSNPSALHVAEETELHKAAEQNHVEKMKELIYLDSTLLNSRDRDGKTSLHVACEMDNTEAAECLLSYKDCLVDIADKYEKYALHYAAENGNVDIMKNILNREMYIPKQFEKKDVNGETALYLACKYGKIKVVEFVLPYTEKCFVNVGDGKDEKCTIHCASKNGYVEIVKLLLEHRPLLLFKRDRDGETSLHLACAVGNLEVVDFLLNIKNLELNVKDKWGNTCFHVAALSKDCKILSTLLKKEPNFLKSKNQKGRTALHVAASIRNDTVIEFLLNLENCDVNVQDIYGDTPLHLYVDCYKHKYFNIENTDITIFRQKSLVNIANQDGESPLHRAVLVADHESVNKLIELGADVNMKNNSGKTPVDLAHTIVDSFEKELIKTYLNDATNEET